MKVAVTRSDATAQLRAVFDASVARSVSAAGKNAALVQAHLNKVRALLWSPGRSQSDQFGKAFFALLDENISAAASPAGKSCAASAQLA